MREAVQRLRENLLAHPPARLRSYVEGCRCVIPTSVFQPYVLSVDCPLHGMPELRKLIDDVRASRLERVSPQDLQSEGL